MGKLRPMATPNPARRALRKIAALTNRDERTVAKVLLGEHTTLTNEDEEAIRVTARALGGFERSDFNTTRRMA